MRGGNRSFGLDVIRALAIGLVLIAHTVLFGDKIYVLGLFRLFCAVLGVELFFVLSGYLIGGIILDAINRPATSLYNWGVANFWLRRWFRTLPLYFFVLLIAFFFTIPVGDVNSVSWRDFIFFQNFDRPFNGYIGVAWSLAVEEWFYLLFPLILMFFWFLFRSGNRAYIASLLSMILVAFLFRLSVSPSENWDAQIRKVVVCRLDAIAIGLALAWICRFRPSWISASKLFMLVGAIMLLGCVIFVACLDRLGAWGDIYGLPFVSLTCACLVIGVMPIANWGYSTYYINRISVLSYSLYLWHPIVLGITLIILNLGPGVEGAYFQKGLRVCLSWVLFFPLAWISYNYIEKPCLKLRDKLVPNLK